MRPIALILGAAAVLAACASASPPAPLLQTDRALYSVKDRTVLCNVTSRVASVCDGRPSCAVVAESALCSMGDPAPSRAKILAVEYRCSASGPQQAVVPQGATLALACPP